MILRTKLLASAAVVAGAVGLIGAGTFASFSARTTNPGNTFATGSLVLSDKVGTGTACLSTGSGTSTDTNVNTACDAAFSLTLQKPGDSATASLTLKNEGTLNASALKAFGSACTDANAAGETYNGTGSPCGAIQVYVQRFSDAAMTTPSACVYGGGTATTCDFADAKTLTAFGTSHGSATNAVSLGSLDAGASAYVKVGVKLPSAADNTLQGRQAAVDLSWTLEQ